jgi:hypothetical protein
MQATTAGVLAGCSDLVAQKLSGAKKLQLRRSLLMLVRRRLQQIYYYARKPLARIMLCVSWNSTLSLRAEWQLHRIIASSPRMSV